MRNRLLFIFIVALLLRVTVVLLGLGYDKDLAFFDARDYDRYALNILSGKGFTNGHAQASRAPLYPLFLAFLYRCFGHSYLAVRLVQSLLSALVVVMLYGILRVFFSKGVSLAACAMAACHPLFLIYAGNILSETLALFLLSFFLWVFVRGGKGRLWGGGVLLGFVLLCRPSLVFFLPFVLFRLLREEKKGMSALLGFAVSMMVVLSPWILRNYFVLQAFVPLTTNGGVTFWDANNPESLLDPSKTGLASQWLAPGKIVKKEGDREIHLSEVAGDRHLYRKGLLFWKTLLKEKPLAFAYLELRKALAAFSLHGGKTPLALTLFALLYLVLLPLGLWRSLHFQHRPFLLYGVILQYLLCSLVFFGRAKYRIVVEPYLIPFVVLGSMASWRGFVRRMRH